MALNITKKDAVGEVTKQSKTGQKSEEQIKVGEVISSLPLANVGFSTSYTKNLGNYESVKIGVSLHIPVPLDVFNQIDEESLSESFKFATDWVESKMTEVINELNNPKPDLQDKNEIEGISG